MADRAAGRAPSCVTPRGSAEERAEGRVFVLLDGVDEVPEAGLRRATVQAVEAFLTAGTGCPGGLLCGVPAFTVYHAG